MYSSHTHKQCMVWLVHISSQPLNNSTLATHVHKNFIGFRCELGYKAIQRTRYYRSRSQLQYPNHKITFSRQYGGRTNTKNMANFVCTIHSSLMHICMADKHHSIFNHITLFIDKQ